MRWIGKVLKNGKVYKLSKADRETKKHFKWSDMLSFMCRHAYPLQLAADMNREKPAVATKINFILFTHFNPLQPLLWQNINAQRRSFLRDWWSFLLLALAFVACGTTEKQLMLFDVKLVETLRLVHSNPFKVMVSVLECIFQEWNVDHPTLFQLPFGYSV